MDERQQLRSRTEAPKNVTRVGKFLELFISTHCHFFTLALCQGRALWLRERGSQRLFPTPDAGRTGRAVEGGSARLWAWAGGGPHCSGPALQALAGFSDGGV